MKKEDIIRPEEIIIQNIEFSSKIDDRFGEIQERTIGFVKERYKEYGSCPYLIQFYSEEDEITINIMIEMNYEYDPGNLTGYVRDREASCGLFSYFIEKNLVPDNLVIEINIIRTFTNRIKGNKSKLSKYRDDLKKIENYQYNAKRMLRRNVTERKDLMHPEEIIIQRIKFFQQINDSFREIKGEAIGFICNHYKDGAFSPYAIQFECKENELTINILIEMDYEWAPGNPTVYVQDREASCGLFSYLVEENLVPDNLVIEINIIRTYTNCIKGTRDKLPEYIEDLKTIRIIDVTQNEC